MTEYCEPRIGVATLLGVFFFFVTSAGLRARVLQPSANRSWTLAFSFPRADVGKLAICLVLHPRKRGAHRDLSQMKSRAAVCSRFDPSSQPWSASPVFSSMTSWRTDHSCGVLLAECDALLREHAVQHKTNLLRAGAWRNYGVVVCFCDILWEKEGALLWKSTCEFTDCRIRCFDPPDLPWLRFPTPRWVLKSTKPANPPVNIVELWHTGLMVLKKFS